MPGTAGRERRKKSGGPARTQTVTMRKRYYDWKRKGTSGNKSKNHLLTRRRVTTKEEAYGVGPGQSYIGSYFLNRKKAGRAG